MTPIESVSASGTPNQNEERRLAQAARELQGVFVQQLFKAMRETVPDDGAVNGGTGEEMFSGLLDQHVADQVPAQWSGALGDALLRQFRAAASSGGPAT